MEVIKKTKVFCVNFHFSSKDCSGSVSGFSYFAGIMGFASGLTLIPMQSGMERHHSWQRECMNLFRLRFVEHRMD